MRDCECVQFLQWALPRMGMCWPGFRKVRKQVCKRLRRRLGVLGLADSGAYQAYLEHHPEEWRLLDNLARITISRFFRDRGVFTFLEQTVLPVLAHQALAAGETRLRIWSAGCACGEEPYSLALLWRLRLTRVYPALDLQILASDIDEAVLRRAREGCYDASSLRGLPSGWRKLVFTECAGRFCLRPEFRPQVSWRIHDIRADVPDGWFHLILCRNLAFTYFDPWQQRRIASLLHRALKPGGALVVGAHEQLPDSFAGLVRWTGGSCIYRKQ